MKMQTSISRNLAATAFASAALASLKVLALPYSLLAFSLFTLLSVGTFFGGRRGAAWAVLEFPQLLYFAVFFAAYIAMLLTGLLQSQ